MPPRAPRPHADGNPPSPASEPRNGHAHAAPLALSPPPTAVAELAASCVRYVKQSLGIELDFEPETLPLLDHYLEQARGSLAALRSAPRTLAEAHAPAALPPQATLLIATAGAYFGEVVRRRHDAWWRAEGDDPLAYRVELGSAFVALSPMAMVAALLLRVDAPPGPSNTDDDADEDDEAPEDESDEHDDAGLRAFDEAPRGPLDEAAALVLASDDERAAVSARLAQLPPMREADYHALSTRLEVLDIAVEALRAAASGPPPRLDPGDYDD